MLLTGAQILIECLIEQQTDVIFGYPGGRVLPIYDVLYENQHRIRHILAAHEQGAAHAADGYARATGKVGVCLSTSGPGATNLVTGIATAYMDSTPTVFITGNVPNAMIGTDGFQEVDITGITLPITKNNWIVNNIKDLAPIIRQAFALCQKGRPGPVLIDMPQDIQNGLCEYTPMEKTAKSTRTLAQRAQLWAERNKESLENAVDMILNAERPFMLVGGGVIRSELPENLITFAEKIQTPVVTSLMGHGGFPATHRQYLGNLGMHGSARNNNAAYHADLYIAVGTRFSDRVSSGEEKFESDCKILHIDIDRAEINKNIPTDHYLIGDSAVVIEALNQSIKQEKLADKTPWLEKVLATEILSVPARGKLDPQKMFSALREKLGADGIVATDVGQHQMWTAQFYPFEKPKKFITSGGLGTMGFGMGAAVGAKIGRSDLPVALITGDGCLRMNLIEMATLDANKIPVIIIVMNNGTLGMVRQWQTLLYNQHYSATTLNFAPDFVAVAKAYNLEAQRVTTQEEFEAALDQGLALKGQSMLIDCLIDIDEMVRPMVKPGQPMINFALD